MVQIPAEVNEDKKTETERLIEDHEIDGEVRPYLGISGIANDCARDLWYNFRLCSKQKLTPRLKRLFARGHREEPIIIADLLKIGIITYGDQYECVAGHGHILGHCDGKAINVPDAPKTKHLLEFKTASNKNFKKFVKANDLEIAHPVYYGQVVCYMYLMGLTRTLFIVVNKDNDERHYERVKCSTDHAKELLARAEDIISTDIPPAKIAGPSYYRCKFCDNYDICHFNGKINKTCRTCKKCEIHEDGKWKCSKHGIWLAFDQQQLACDQYEILNSL